MSAFRKSLHLLTDKPMLYVGNIGEIDLIDIRKSKHAKTLLDYVKKNNNNVVFLCASIEQEISLLNISEQKLFLSEYNLKEPGLDKVIRSSFDLLGLYFLYLWS